MLLIRLSLLSSLRHLQPVVEKLIIYCTTEIKNEAILWDNDIPTGENFHKGKEGCRDFIS
jgi:hypothetical protein